MREMGKLVPTVLSIAMLALVCVSFLQPATTEAAFNAAGIKHCGFVEPNGCGPCSGKCGSKCKACGNKFMCDCWDETNKAGTWGKCTLTKFCKGTGFEGIDGKSQGTGQLGDFLGKVFGEVLKQLMQPKQGGGSGGAPSGLEQQYAPCVFNSATNTMSPVPCRNADGTINYTGTTSSTSPILTTSGLGTGSNVSDILLGVLGGETDTEKTVPNLQTQVQALRAQVTTVCNGKSPVVGDVATTVIELEGQVAALLEQIAACQGSSTHTEDTSGKDSATGTQSTTEAQRPGGTTISQAQLELTLRQQGLSPSDARRVAEAALQGDVTFGDSGATIFARARDPGSNTEVAGFFGGNTFNPQQSRGLVGRMCLARPWARGVISVLLFPAFFDRLCERTGYSVRDGTETPVGTVAPRRPTITITQPVKQSEEKTIIVQPLVDIWADPPNVRLGARTYIFWNTRGVISCKETGPSFLQNTLAGGASTVPIAGTSTFTIECQTDDGRTFTDSVRVTLDL